MQNLPIKEGKWWVQETVARLQLCYPWMRGFAKTGRYYNPAYGYSLSFFKDDYIWSIMEEDRDFLIAAAIHDKFHVNPGTLEEKIKVWHSFKTKIEADFDTIHGLDMGELDRRELFGLYQSLFSHNEEVYTPALLCEAFVPYAERYVIPEISRLTQKHGIGKGEKVAGVLTVPLVASNLTQERIKLLQLILRVFGDQETLSLLSSDQALVKIQEFKPELYDALVAHQKKYFWIKNNYKDVEPITCQEFYGYICEEVKRGRAAVEDELARLEKNPASLAKEKAELMSRLQPDERLMSAIKLFEILGEWQDERKVVMQKAVYYLTLLLRAVSARVNIPFELIAYATPEEIGEMLDGKEGISRDKLEQRQKFCAVLVTESGEEILLGAEAQGLWDKIFKKGQVKEKCVYGVVACTGRVRGKVRIVKDPAKDKFDEGEILVTSMTRPEFVPYMKKALGIVTDEGGLTCHAAIVSRELGIPCIVGTKVATKVLKDGDLVEVNASHGSVTKL